MTDNPTTPNVTFDERAREHLDQIWRRRTEMSIEEFNAEATAANANALLALKLPLEDMAEQLLIAIEALRRI